MLNYTLEETESLAPQVQSERADQDARWIYYSVNRQKLAQLDVAMRYLLDVNRIQPRQPSCGPRSCAAC